MSIPEPLAIPDQLSIVTSCLDDRIENVALGDEVIEDAALRAAKYIFDMSLETEKESKNSIDELLASLNPFQAPQTRSQSKLGHHPFHPPPSQKFEPTPLSSLLIEGLDSEQIWVQLDLRARAVCDLLDFALDGGTGGDSEDLSNEESEDERLRKVIEALENGDEVDLEALQAQLDDEMDVEDESEVSESDESEESGDNVADDEEDVVRLQLSDEEFSDSDTKPTLFNLIQPGMSSKKKGPYGLNDGFFDLDTFNAETEQAEARSSSRGRLAENPDDSDDSAMSVDFFAPIQDEQDEVEDTSDILYRDFFDPPKKISAQQARVREAEKLSQGGRVRFHDEVRVKKIKAKGKNLPLRLLYGMGDMGDDEDEDDENDENGDGMDDIQWEENEGSESDLDGDESAESDQVSEDEFSLQSQDSESVDGRKIIERLKNDLFADEQPAVEDDMTAHEQRQATLRQQIAQLESENSAKKDWKLLGEADSRGRPQNSLLEEDLEFERVMKPVPVISEEVVEDLERRIKTRILENRFDDVVRIRISEEKLFLPSRLLELQDTKSTQSLAQIYEEDYIANQGRDDGNGKLKKEHEEIEQQWEKMCSKLDALCNAHFVPKPPKAVISTISNVATAAVESATPVAKATSTVLAPEEIFNPASSETRSRDELTPTEKRTLRTKERKAKKKERDILEKRVGKTAKSAKGIGKIKKEKQAALQSVVKAGKGVTVLGKQAKDLALTGKRKKS